MLNISTDTRTRDAMRNAHDIRSHALRAMLNRIFHPRQQG